ncbi:HugZ family heme oxygenase [Helicobacter bizzozeronii]|uniref:HugZ family heme oxygenase n=1 Tax=Helicobacter bizzozeronii TaxID=56877 RepID=UPI000CEE9439|nr:HugZ family heme oxygenase [Helicobacter bizzozeronii]
MDISFIVKHMNENHVPDMEALLAKFGQVRGARDVRMKNADMGGMDIVYVMDGRESMLRIDFPAKVESVEGVKDAIIEMCRSLAKTTDMDEVRADLERFRESFSTVCIASLSPENEVICSYSALLFDDRDGRRQFYIYVSEVAEHFNSIKAHPDNVEIMFLEGEATAKSPILRRRLRYRTRVTFMERGVEFDRIYDNFIQKHGKGRGLETIRHMQDFHLIKLDFIRGRFVKGFGQAYDIDAHGNITYVGSKGNPHTMKDRRDHSVDRHPEHPHHPHGHPHADRRDRHEHPHRDHGRDERISH